MKKWKKWLAAAAALFITLSIGTSVIADDHDDDDDEKHEYYEKHHDEDDDEQWESQQPAVPYQQQTDYWNIWSKEPMNNPEKVLPIENPEELLINSGEIEKKIYLIPKDGQLLVSADSIAEILGATSTFYPTSKICLLKKGDLELIVKAGSNAAYENKVKSPMPVNAAAYENSIYLPISVAANALGYRVTWNEAKKAIVLQSL
ncbi:copper amine oxidase N-terminal domain-containing protein [Neobacillus mesonae]|uniref:copper amine oxidase N-terminal domain-containing protein n=1 Tax=Neobacillus mesonae TaxID=1193713 RepID=UPI00082A8A56|nr:copper amine oxidase N-terminal domain-containing protein [Neobacillus mesonae]